MCFGVNTVLILLVCVSIADQALSLQDQCSSLPLHVDADADVKITAIVSVRDSSEDGQCGTEIADSAVQYIGLIQWVVQRLNAASFIDGVRIGVDVYDDCGLPRHSIARALDVVDGQPLGSQACGRTNGTACHIGILGPSLSSTAGAVLDIIQGIEVPVISPYATDPHLTSHGNFYRTTPSEDYEVEAVLGLLKHLGWTYVAAVHTDDRYGTYGVQELTRRAKLGGICVDAIHEIKLEEPFDMSLFTALLRHIDMTKDGTMGVVLYGNKHIAKTVLTQLKFEVSRNSKLAGIAWIMSGRVGTDTAVFESLETSESKIVTLAQYVEFITDAQSFITRKWERAISGQTPVDDLERLMVCAGRSTVPDWTTNYVSSTIDAVYAFAQTLQRKQRFHCGVQAGVCENLKLDFKHDITSYPVAYSTLADNFTVEEFKSSGRSVSFASDGELVPDPGLPMYTYSMYIHNTTRVRFSEVGEFRNNTADITDGPALYNLPVSDCGASCPACVDSTGIRYAYLDGDTLLLGLFSLHEINTDNPFDCGNFRFTSNDAIIIEAFIHAVEKLRESTGIHFGALVLDNCYSLKPTEFLLPLILSGQHVLYKPNSSNEAIDVSTIAAVVVSLNSDETIPIAHLLTKLRLPLISSAASSPDLDDRINFPYFLRTVPSDDEQARAMVGIINRMEWKFVSVVYVKNNYGSKLKEKFVQLAEASNICIADEPEGISDTDNDTIELQALFARVSNHKSQVVVYLGTERHIANFLGVINNRNDFIFLASEDWGDRQYILDVGGEATMGSITLKNEIADLEGNTFSEHIRLANAYSNSINPWFGDYWERMFQCDLPQSFTNKYRKVCEESQLFPEDAVQNFLTDQRIVHTVKAVHALGKGLAAAKEDTCKFKDTFPCKKYHEYIYPDVIKDIREVTLREGNSDVRVFTEDGNGNIGFLILNIHADATRQLDYKTIGWYDDGILNLPPEDVILNKENFNAQCMGDLCSSCRSSDVTSTMVTTTHAHPEEDKFGIDDYTIIGILAFLSMFMLVLFIISICYLRKRVTALERQLKETATQIYRDRVALTAGYTSQNGSAVRTTLASSSAMYVDANPLEHPVEEWRRANSEVRTSAGGMVNPAFISNEMYFHDNTDQNQNVASSPIDVETTPVKKKHITSPKTETSPTSQHMYGLSTHHSFKRQDPQAQHNSPLKKQPRTQLNVPPIRPELPPPRTDAAPRPHTFPDDLNLISPSIPNDLGPGARSKAQRMCSPKRSKPVVLKHSRSQGDSPRYSGEASSPQYNADSPQYNDSPPYMAFSSGSAQSSDQQNSPTSRINVAGSMEKVSRV